MHTQMQTQYFSICSPCGAKVETEGNRCTHRCRLSTFLYAHLVELKWKLRATDAHTDADSVLSTCSPCGAQVETEGNPNCVSVVVVVVVFLAYHNYSKRLIAK